MSMYSPEWQDAQAATDAGTAVCDERRSHYLENIAGLASTAGDTAPQEEPTLQSIPGPAIQSTT